MTQSANGQYVTYAEFEEAIRELAESIDQYFLQVQAGELSANDASAAMKMQIRLLRGDLGL